MCASLAGRRTNVLALTREAELGRLVKSILEPRCKVTAAPVPSPRRAANETVDIVIVDLETLELERIVRARRAYLGAQIIAIGRAFSETDCIAALDADADYLPRPFREKDLTARVRVAEFRRFHAAGRRGRLYRKGPFVFDLLDRKAFSNGVEVALTPSETTVLLLLAGQAGAVATYDRLIAALGLKAGPKARHALRASVFRLRRKIEPDGSRPQILLSDVGVGYRLVPPEPDLPVPEPERASSEKNRSFSS